MTNHMDLDTCVHSMNTINVLFGLPWLDEHSTSDPEKAGESVLGVPPPPPPAFNLLEGPGPSCSCIARESQGRAGPDKPGQEVPVQGEKGHDT